MNPFLRLGLELPALPTRGGGGTDVAPAWVEAAVAAERAGFGAVWLAGVDCDPCTLAGALAPHTASLTLGVVAEVGRGPSVLARDVTALDVLSSGRSAVLLQGDGWDQLAEAATVCRLLFTEEEPSFDGRYFRLARAANRPPPVRPGGPPVLVQGPSLPGAPPRAVVAAAAAADALVVTGGPADVTSWRKLVGGRALFWRGELPAGNGATGGAVALQEAGADGLIVRLPASEEAVVSTGRALAARWAP